VLLLAWLALTWTPARAQDANGLTWPRPGATLSGVVTVRGVADHPTFRKWQVDLILGGEGGHATFLALGEEPLPTSAPLFDWDTTRYPNGRHLLRLRVVRDHLDYDEYFTPITLNNRGAPVYQPPPTPTPLAPEETLRSGGAGGERWIEIDISDQRLTAWEGDTPVMQVTVSTGKPGYRTLPGTFRIYRKYEQAHMRGEDYDTPDVPWTMYYYGSFAIHGAYWHNNFGAPVSHGCVNLPVPESKQLFQWADVGAKVVVHQ
jgi:lipoprotein-anchoring transpeptidase ErfK/SrfK